MCNICDGRHVIHVETGLGVQFRDCPNCEPIDPVEHNAKLRSLLAEVESISAKKVMKGA